MVSHHAYIFDHTNIFWQFFKNSLKHSKADDHLTCISILIPIDADPAEVRSRIEKLVLECRFLLDDATKTVGCGLNLEKSEVITSKNWITPEIESKISFVWLGYSLELTNQYYLKFTETRMIQKFNFARQCMDNVFQHLTDQYTKLRIWSVYISPIIEWFLPVIAINKRHEFAGSNKIQAFQHSTLGSVFGALQSVSRIKLCKVACVRPINQRLLKLGNRLREFVTTSTQDLLTEPINHVASTYNLRSGHYNRASKWVNVETKDFTDQVIMLQDELNTIQVHDESIMGRFERDSRHRVKFNKVSAKLEIIRLNRIARNNWENSARNAEHWR